VAKKHTQKPLLKRPSRRTRIVWGSFVLAMTAVTGLLAVGDTEGPGGFIATNLGSLGASPAAGETTSSDPVFRITAPLDRDRWRGIVIHHLGTPAGDADSIHRQHLSYGYQGLGYHFLIGNGNGLGDGVVHVGYRWNQQLPGAHAVGPDSEHHNLHSIGICLVGNGDRRPFTDRQIRSLTVLVQRLQREIGLPEDRVFLHRDVAPEVGSPGRYFPEARLRSQVLSGR
jgi:N-acetyl-anhydromuramyl-L-alanine amidase AmpD